MPTPETGTRSEPRPRDPAAAAAHEARIVAHGLRVNAEKARVTALHLARDAADRAASRPAEVPGDPEPATIPPALSPAP